MDLITPLFFFPKSCPFAVDIPRACKDGSYKKFTYTPVRKTLIFLIILDFPLILALL